jgi:phenylacetic acid degradation operon negative regulatory protein
VSTPAAADGVSPGSARPQSLLLSFLGIHVLDRGIAVYTGSVIDVFAKAGISEQAVRSTLARMSARELLVRHRRGRKVYVGLTPRSTEVLRDGHRRVWTAGAVNRDWDGSWTVVGFSLPDSWRSKRHELRSKLQWAGFGVLHSGIWIAPGEVDVTAIVDELGLSEHVSALHGRAALPTGAPQLIARAFDTAGIAAKYEAFLGRWDVGQPFAELPDDFARHLVLHTDWLEVIRNDPHLPAEHLPSGWPAIRAEQVFQLLAERYETGATKIADGLLDIIELAEPAVVAE